MCSVANGLDAGEELGSFKIREWGFMLSWMELHFFWRLGFAVWAYMRGHDLRASSNVISQSHNLFYVIILLARQADFSFLKKIMTSLIMSVASICIFDRFHLLYLLIGFKMCYCSIITGWNLLKFYLLYPTEMNGPKLVMLVHFNVSTLSRNNIWYSPLLAFLGVICIKARKKLE